MPPKKKTEEESGTICGFLLIPSLYSHDEGDEEKSVGFPMWTVPFVSPWLKKRSSHFDWAQGFVSKRRES
jgi:hypothetical protein